MTSRQSNLLRKARQKLLVAQDLWRLGHLEDAVSRAYYVMFYIAAAFLDGEGLRFSSHSAVISEFGRVFAKTGRVPSEFHRWLLEAEQDRLGGDYRDVYTVQAEVAEKHLRNAERFLRIAEDLIGSPESS